MLRQKGIPPRLCVRKRIYPASFRSLRNPKLFRERERYIPQSKSFPSKSPRAQLSKLKCPPVILVAADLPAGPSTDRDRSEHERQYERRRERALAHPQAERLEEADGPGHALGQRVLALVETDSRGQAAVRRERALQAAQAAIE